jgi:hypothetical protein
MKYLAQIALAVLLGMPAAASALTAQVVVNDPTAPALFARDEVDAALRSRKFQVVNEFIKPAVAVGGGKKVIVWFKDVNDASNMSADTPEIQEAARRIRAEGFLLRRDDREGDVFFTVLSKDPGGAMYGGLELAEQIRTRGIAGVTDTDRNPYLPLRGTKFNIPLDLRTPSYSDMSDSAQQNIPTVWDFEFWRAYLDQLARDRYNMVSLWNLHPFPSMVRVPEYPDVALDDVWRSKGPFEENYSTRTTDIVTPAMLANHEVVKQLSIAQKIDFWRRVMQYAHDRNIAIYVITWNVYTYGVGGKYGITDTLDNPKTVDYFRASVREMFRTYPLLAGIGLTAGENMGDASAYYARGTDSFNAQENWLFSTYGQGLLDAARAEPQRQFRLIHRQHETRVQDIAATFEPVIAQPNVDFVFSFKYAQAHALSSTTQNFHRGYLETLGPLNTLWTLRNDDALLLRWAAPDFVRDFIGNMPREKSQGFYFGSDMWVWGREFLSRSPRTPRQLEIDKHWLHFLLWGRLGYDPTLDDTRIAQLVAQRFPGVDGATLLRAWQHASKIYPLVTGFHWANYDFQWYIEACRSRPEPAKTASGFHSVDTFINQPVHPATDNLTIPQLVERVMTGKYAKGTTPMDVAGAIGAHSDAALENLEKLGQSAQDNVAEFQQTLDDIYLMAMLGKYYAAKIRGATLLALYRANRDPRSQAGAIHDLTLAASYWREYSRRVQLAYGPGYWTNRVGRVDWAQLSREVAHDIDIARVPLK